MEKIIELTGRIDSTNSNKLEEEILKEIENYKGEIIFDAKKLDYISSAGLRVILNIKKKNDETKVINCKPEIYEIFDMTGFVEMMDISKAYREISIENCLLDDIKSIHFFHDCIFAGSLSFTINT